MSLKRRENGRGHEKRTFQKVNQRETVLITGEESVEIVTRAAEGELGRFAAIEEEGERDLFAFPIALDLGDIPAAGLGHMEIALNLAGDFAIGIVDDEDIEFATIRGPADGGAGTAERGAARARF